MIRTRELKRLLPWIERNHKPLSAVCFIRDAKRLIFIRIDRSWSDDDLMIGHDTRSRPGQIHCAPSISTKRPASAPGVTHWCATPFMIFLPVSDQA